MNASLCSECPSPTFPSGSLLLILQVISQRSRIDFLSLTCFCSTVWLFCTTLKKIVIVSVSVFTFHEGRAMFTLFTTIFPVLGTVLGIQEFQNVKENRAEWCQGIWRVISEDSDLLSIKLDGRASLVVQWLRICLLMQGTRVRALVWEDSTCQGATGPVNHNYWACASGACAPQ